MHIALLTGGIAAEDYLSRRSAEVVEEALRNYDYEISILDWQRSREIFLRKSCNSDILKTWNNLAECFSEFRPDVVFNTLHGEWENAGQLQGFFELLNIPYTGNGLSSSVLGMDKILSKTMFDALEVLHPESHYLGFPHLINTDDAMAALENQHMKFPFMLKRTHGGSSETVEMVESADEFKSHWKKWRHSESHYGYPAFVEEYIEGTEYCVGIFGHWAEKELEVLPIARICFSGKFFDKTIKYDDTYVVECDNEIPAATRNNMIDSTLKVHRYLRFTGFSRMDFRVKENLVYALEVNTHPGLSQFSIIPNMLKCSTLNMEEACKIMVEWALKAPKSA